MILFFLLLSFIQIRDHHEQHTQDDERHPAGAVDGPGTV